MKSEMSLELSVFVVVVIIVVVVLIIIIIIICGLLSQLVTAHIQSMTGRSCFQFVISPTGEGTPVCSPNSLLGGEVGVPLVSGPRYLLMEGAGYSSQDQERTPALPLLLGRDQDRGIPNLYLSPQQGPQQGYAPPPTSPPHRGHNTLLTGYAAGGLPCFNN